MRNWPRVLGLGIIGLMGLMEVLGFQVRVSGCCDLGFRGTHTFVVMGPFSVLRWVAVGKLNHNPPPPPSLIPEP